MKEDKIKEVCELIRSSKYCIVFTGAGISVESGIPPFRGDGGVYNDLDLEDLYLPNYLSNPTKSWLTIRDLLFKTGKGFKPNKAHNVLAKLEESNLIKAIITQNIDNLHQEAGSKNICELHGNGKYFVCTKCDHHDEFKDIELDINYPKCSSCGSLTKPNFTFFGEELPFDEFETANEHIDKCDLIIIIGTSGEVHPAASLPLIVKDNGGKIIEINVSRSAYTNNSDITIYGKAGEILTQIEKELINNES